MHTKIKREIKTTFTNEIANQYWKLEIYGDMHRELSQLEEFVSRWNENDYFRLQFYFNIRQGGWQRQKQILFITVWRLKIKDQSCHVLFYEPLLGS